MPSYMQLQLDGTIGSCCPTAVDHYAIDPATGVLRFYYADSCDTGKSSVRHRLLFQKIPVTAMRLVRQSSANARMLLWGAF